MNKYQMLFIVENSLDEETKAATVDRYTELIVSLGGTIQTVDKWGTKAFAYPINYKTEGYYVLVTFESDGSILTEIDRQMRINDKIIRQMITKV